MNFGNQHLTRSDNAQVQKNPLIGNYIVDPNTVEAGVEVIGNNGRFNWLVGFGSGVAVEDFQPGRGYSLHGKVWVEPGDSRFNVAASAYRANHAATRRAIRTTDRVKNCSPAIGVVAGTLGSSR